MENFNRKKHWENIYQTKQLNEVGWFQPKPETSLHFIEQLNISKTAKIIDIGGGDSFLVDNLLELGYLDITVLDISKAALERAKLRLGSLAKKAKWIVSDVTNFQVYEQYNLWHDRAAFHFLTKENEIESYLKIVRQAVKQNGIFILGTFSDSGPKKCSGIEIKQYSESTITDLFNSGFEKIKCISVDHKTPFDTLQNFIFCSFRKIRGLKSSEKEIITTSIICCPHCNHKKIEEMPENACQYFYECENCLTILKPKKGDCCVYCSFGTVKCPPAQQHKCCEKS